ncbi:unnamed protein product [Phaeothamnion confervicola]
MRAALQCVVLGLPCAGLPATSTMTTAFHQASLLPAACQANLVQPLSNAPAIRAAADFPLLLASSHPIADVRDTVSTFLHPVAPAVAGTVVLAMTAAQLLFFFFALRAATGTGKQIAKVASSIPASALVKLCICLIVDACGDSMLVLPPPLSWGAHIVAGPFEAVALSLLFGSNTLSAIGFIEEVLPFTEVIPLATLAWVLKYFFSDTLLASALGLRQGGGSDGNGGKDSGGQRWWKKPW